MKKIHLISLTVMTALLTSAGAATHDNNATAWFNYIGDHNIGDVPLGLHLDAQIRRDNLGLDQQQYLIQPGVNYKLNERFTLGGGFGYLRTYPYGEFPVAAPVNEHRVGEQFSTSTPAIGLNWNHRLRLEQRTIGRAGNYRYENRTRYRLLTTIPLPCGKEGQYHLKSFDEVFVNFGSNVARNTCDQNRADLAVVRRLSKHVKMEVGFMEQTVQHRNGRVFENNHTVMVSSFSGRPLGGR